MKRNKRRRLGAWLLAVVFFVLAISGILHPEMIQADATSIERWNENELMDYGYRFNVKFQPGITKAKTFGCDNQDKIAFTNHGRSERNADTVRMTGNYQPESAGVRYYNVGRDGEGNIIDFRLSLVSVKNPEPRYDMRTAIDRQKEAEGTGTADSAYDFPDHIGKPLVGFALEEIGIFIYCVDSARVRMEFLKNGTDEPIAISGHGTVRDLDARQGIQIPPSSGIDKVYVLSDNTFLDIEGMKVTAKDGSLEPGDKTGWVNYLYNTNSMNFDFVHEAQAKRWDAEREKGIARYGSPQAWAEKIKQRRTDSKGVCHCPDFQGQKFMKGHAYFDFTAYCFGGIAMNRAPEKRVGKAGCTWEEGVPADDRHPFAIRDFEEFQYMIQTEVTPNQFKKFVVEDRLEDCLEFSDTSKIQILDETGLDVTEKFELSVQGQRITCSGKPEALGQEEFSNNKLYTFFFQVHRKPEAEVSGYMAPDGYSILVPNQATMSYERLNGTGDTMTSNTVWVRGVIKPELEIRKEVSKYEWGAEELVDYRVTLTQTKKHTRAVNVVMEDVVSPGLQLLEEGCQVEAPGVADCTLSFQGQSGWRLQCPSLGYGQSITVVFRCRALLEANGQEVGNTVSATAENLLNPETMEQESVKDMAEVWINSPQLLLDKGADKYEWYVGDQVSYRVTVNNPVPGTIARNVQITDIGLPEGLLLSGGVQNVEVLDVLPEVQEPVPDKKTGQSFQSVPVESRLEGDERGFSFYCSHLPYNQPITLVFRCVATENANGRESVNVASVQAGNAPANTDDAEIFVNSGEFRIEKTADHYEWQVGEQVEYTVLVENIRPGTIARNVTVWDTDMPPGLSLASPDSVVIQGIPERATQPVAGTLDPPGGVNPEHYNETGEKEIHYQFAPEGAGWRLHLTDLPFATPVTISFLCTVTEEANGHESINLANVQAENTPPQGAEEEIYVNTAVLGMKKTVNNPYLAVQDHREPYEFRVGEQIPYQVVVENLQKGSIAKNVVISDLSLPKGLTLSPEEGAVKVQGIPDKVFYPVAEEENGGNNQNTQEPDKVVEIPVSFQLLREGTGWILTISHLPYRAPVTIDFLCIAEEAVNGMEIVNTASARADNGKEVKAEAKVWINSPILKVAKTTDKPSYKYGDIMTCRVELSQEQTGCVARNVTLADVIDTPGVRLLKDSIVLMDEKGNRVEPQEVRAGDDNTFLISTGRPLVKDGRYTICHNSQGDLVEQVLLNPLNLYGERKMIVEYCVAVIDEKLAGQKVHNKATANSLENLPQSGEATAEIHSPILEVNKISDKKEYLTEEKGYYTLTLRQLREDVTAEQVVIEDSIQTPGAVIRAGSILLKKNGETMKNVKIEGSDTGFRITTGTSLSDRDKLEVCYEVLFKKMPPKGVVVNTARAWAEGTPEEKAANEVYVKEAPKPEPTPTPSPEPTPTPQPAPTLKPTGTPVPQAPSCPKLSPAPTRYPNPVYNNPNNFGGSSGTNGGNSGTYYPGGGNTSYGNYQTGGAKTGDVRPFAQMERLGVLGLLLLFAGLYFYKRAKREKKN